MPAMRDKHKHQRPAMKAPALKKLITERSNPASRDLDTLSPIQIARIINREDAKVAAAVRRALPQVARAIQVVATALDAGGRLFYVGAGTSGRIAALDAAECVPTFNTSPETVQYVIAGGEKALAAAAEYNEDNPRAGERDLAQRKPGKKDVVVGIAASGRTPYTLGALQYARRRGARTIALTCNPGSPLQKAAELAIVVQVGPEVISGSTRMKAGTAQKMVLNMLTTGAMTRLGRVYGNLMVNVHLKNQKLRERAVAILERAAGVTRTEAQQALRESGDQLPVGLVMLLSGAGRAQAQSALKSAGGNVRKALKRVRKH
jgi:N-acetylmuramic acid 6-phosphate etherase